VLKRPGVDLFLAEMSIYYEIVLYTASLPIYANPLIDLLDPHKYINYRLFREHCTFLNNSYVKDLSQLGRNLKDIIIVDNSPVCYTFQPTNGIPIPTWLNDPNDVMLSQLAPLLKLLSEVDDVRTHLSCIMQTPEIDYIASYNKLKSEQVTTFNKPTYNVNTRRFSCTSHEIATLELKRDTLENDICNKRLKRFSVTSKEVDRESFNKVCKPYTHEIRKIENNVKISVGKKLKEKQLQEEEVESFNESVSAKELARTPKQGIERPMLINSIANGSKKVNRHSSSIVSYDFLNNDAKQLEFSKDNIRISDTNLIRTPMKIPFEKEKIIECLTERGVEAGEIVKKIPTTCYSPGNLMKLQEKNMGPQRKLTSSTKDSSKASSPTLGNITSLSNKT